MLYDELAGTETVQKTIDALRVRGYEVAVCKKGTEALEMIQKLIPEESSVMNGASVTLEQIGFVNYLKSSGDKWNNLHEAILAAEDRKVQMHLRKQAVLSDYYLGSVHALVETGEFVVASNTGSQLAHVVFTSPNLIFVVSTKKIVPTMVEAMKRLTEYVMPLEDKHMREKYGVGTSLNKIVIINGENPILGRKIHFILVEENLGF